MPLPDEFRVGDWLIYRQLNRVERNGKVRSVEPKIMDLLYYFAQHRNEVLPKSRLMQALWPDVFVGDEVLTYSVSELRRALGDEARAPRYLETIPRRGYRLIATVSAPKPEARYQLLSPLAHGAMGEVHLAEDSLLKRRVALKFLPQSLEQDETARHRLLREARAAGGLDHPYICKVHDVGELEGRSFIAMEYVEGETLEHRIAEGPLLIAEALHIGCEIAEALEDAHGKGIVHRDIKPANVILTKGGHVKVADFSVAKRLRGTAGDDQTGTGGLAEDASVRGTLPYMSPEQLRNRPADPRSDIFSLGVTLYQLLTGVHPFKRATQAETVDAILNKTPDPMSRYRTPPPGRNLEQLIAKMLAKAPEDRCQTVHEVRMELERLLEAVGMGGDEERNQPHPFLGRVPLPPRWVIILAGVALLVGLIGVSGFLTRRLVDRSPVPAQVIRSAIELPADTGLAGSFWQGGGRPDRTEIRLSPDGQILVFAAANPSDPKTSMLYRRPLKGDQASPLVGTEGGRQPVFSPDGRWIAYWVSGGQLMKIARDGGIPVEIASGLKEPMGIFWTEDGRILLGGNRSALQWVSAQGGKVRSLTRLDPAKEVRHALPWMLPGGDDVLFTASPQYWGVKARVDAIKLSTGGRKSLLEDAADARYVTTGHLLFLRQGQLMAVPFDRATVRVTGAAVPIQENVQQALNLGVDNANSGSGQFAVSSNGLFVYAAGGINESPESELVWVDRQGKVEPVSGFEKPLLAQLSLSPDGRSVAFTEEPNSGFLWLFDMRRATHARMSLPGVATYPVWSPDGRHLAFTWSAAGPPSVWQVSLDGGRPLQVTRTSASLNTSSWSRDGKLAFVDWGEGSPTGPDILIYTPADQKLVPFLATPAAEMYPQFSPDGRWLSFVSDETGKAEVYLVPLADPTRKTMISNAGGVCPLWAPSGKELFYLETEASRRFMKVDLELGSRVSAAVPRALFSTAGMNLIFTTPVWCSNVSPDGQRFLFSRRKWNRQDDSEQVTRLNLVSNWFEELNRFCPTR